MKNYIVYVHVNKINGKRYIGISSTTLLERAGSNGHKYKGCRYFWSAIEKYGYDNFEHIVIESGLTAKQAEKRERELIKKYNTTNREKGYNIQDGGNISIDGHSEETKKILSERRKEYYETHEVWNKGKKMKDLDPNFKAWNKGKSMKEINPEFKSWNKGIIMIEHDPTYVNPRKGKHLSNKTKQLLSEANKGKVPVNKGKTGLYHHTEKECKKMSDAQKEIWSDEEYKKNRIASMISPTSITTPIKCIETNTVYNSIIEAVKQLDLCERNISDVLNGRAWSHKGLHFEYIDEQKKERAKENLKKLLVYKYVSKNYKPIMHLETKKVYECANEVAKELNIKGITGVIGVCKGTRNTAYGQHFKYITLKEFLSIKYDVNIDDYVKEIKE